MSFWDTAGQEDYDRLRPLSYPDADIILICYSVDIPESLDNIAQKWWPEVHHFCPKVPVIVVVNKTDLRTDEETIARLDVLRQKPVQSDEGRDVATRIGAVAHRECSAKNNDGVREVFEAATRAAIARKRHRHRVCKLL